MTSRFMVGDVHERLADLEDDSVDLVFSSPPFLALRSYLPADHPDKSREIGSEASPAAFLDALLDVVEACDRVLAPHGSLCFELGDTYAGNNQSGWERDKGDYRREVRSARSADGVLQGGPRGNEGWPLDKSLTGIPTLFAWSLAYGRNLLRPERETPQWRIRNLVPWCRPNPPVGALGDKWRPATSFVTVACKSRSRWFDLDAVRTEHQSDPTKYGGNGGPPGSPNEKGSTTPTPGNPNGAPPLDYIVLPTAPYKGAHYATFPPGLVVPFIESMCPREVCRVCGEPRRRVDGDEWTDCSHDDYRRGVVLDPFAGSGTTLAVAEGHGRDSVGIDLDARNLELARERVGMFLVEA